MKTYIVLLRGINVGGKNTISMKVLKSVLEEEGFKNVETYINSGNVILQSTLNEEEVVQKIEKILPSKFKLDSSIIRVLVLSYKDLKKIVDKKPKGFGENPEKYYSDVIFLMGISSDEAMKVFDPREGVDTIWQGDDVIYSQRLGAERTKSKLGKIIGTQAYKSMTIRSWNTTTKLLKIVEELVKKF